ncbi:MAG TPA: Ig-like domain-containing protein [Candidatus Dojkabacteria bacterium]|nr:Ig-like domain-containing protein [Candidatus Dojkabacteria bacterium]
MSKRIKHLFNFLSKVLSVVVVFTMVFPSLNASQYVFAADALSAPTNLGWNLRSMSATPGETDVDLLCGSTTNADYPRYGNGMMAHNWSAVTSGSDTVYYQREYQFPGTSSWIADGTKYTSTYTDFGTLGSNEGVEGTWLTRVRAWVDTNSNGSLDEGVDNVSSWSDECSVTYNRDIPSIDIPTVATDYGSAINGKWFTISANVYGSISTDADACKISYDLGSTWHSYYYDFINSQCSAVFSLTDDTLDGSTANILVSVKGTDGSEATSPMISRPIDMLVNGVTVDIEHDSYTPLTLAADTVKGTFVDNVGGTTEGFIIVADITDLSRPAAPTILSPLPEQHFNTTPILNDWTDVTDDTGIDYYRVEYIYDDGHSFSGGPYRTTTASQRNHIPATTEQGGVTIRVQAVDNEGYEGIWSNPVHYYYDLTAPAVPTNTGFNSTVPDYATEPTQIACGGFTNVNSISHHWSAYEGTGGIDDASVQYMRQWVFPGGDTTNPASWQGAEIWNTNYTNYRTFGTSTGIEGTWYVRVQAKDAIGNWSGYSEPCAITLDMTKPITVLTSEDLTLINDNTPTFTGTSTDERSGLQVLQYKIDEGLWTDFSSLTGELSSNFEFTSPELTDGEHTLYFRAFDRAGNIENTASDTFVVDTTAPRTTVNIIGDLDETKNIAGNGGWHGFGWYESFDLVQLQFITSTLGDKIEYALLDGNVDCSAAVYTEIAADSNINAEVNSKADGIYTLCYRGFDGLGNIEPTNLINLRKDNTIPQYTFNSVSGNEYMGVYYNNTSDLTLSFNITDDNSGYSRARYDLYSATEANACSSLIRTNQDNLYPADTDVTRDLTVTGLSDGHYCLRVWVYDDVQNKAWTQVNGDGWIKFVIDKVAPTSSAIISEDFYGPKTLQTDTVNGTASDESGIKDLTITIRNQLGRYWNGSSWSWTETDLAVNGLETWDYNFFNVSPRFNTFTYTVTPTACDYAGNCATGSEDSFTWDKVSPTIDIERPLSDWQIAGPVSIKGTLIDNVSGIDELRIRVRQYDPMTSTEGAVVYENNVCAEDGVTSDGASCDSLFGIEGKWSATMDPVSMGIPDGTYMIRVRALDNVQNASWDSVIYFTLDNTKPTITQVADQTFNEGDFVDPSFVVGTELTDNIQIDDLYFKILFEGVQGESWDSGYQMVSVNGANTHYILTQEDLDDYLIDQIEYLIGIRRIPMWTYLVPEGRYTVNYYITDEAGNTSECIRPEDTGMKSLSLLPAIAEPVEPEIDACATVLTLNNVAPTTSLTADQTIFEGDTASFIGEFSDPSFNTDIVKWLIEGSTEPTMTLTSEKSDTKLLADSLLPLDLETELDSDSKIEWKEIGTKSISLLEEDTDEEVVIPFMADDQFWTAFVDYGDGSPILAGQFVMPTDPDIDPEDLDLFPYFWDHLYIPDHRYTQEGVYTVTLQVIEGSDYTTYDIFELIGAVGDHIDGEGEFSNTSSVIVTVLNNTPTVSVTPETTTVLTNATVVLNSSIIGGNAPLTKAWSCTDGYSASDVDTISFASSVAGTYQCTLTVTDADGDIASDTSTIIVNNPPVIDYELIYYGIGEVLGEETEKKEETKKDPKPEVLGESVCERTYKVDGYVYYDKNDNGSKDGKERGMAGLVVEITYTNTEGETVKVATVSTAEDGYWNADVCPGDYNISIDESKLPNGYKIAQNALRDFKVDDNDMLGLNIELDKELSFLAKFWWIILLAVLVLGLGGYMIAGRRQNQ